MFGRVEREIHDYVLLRHWTTSQEHRLNTTHTSAAPTGGINNRKIGRQHIPLPDGLTLGSGFVVRSLAGRREWGSIDMLVPAGAAGSGRHTVKILGAACFVEDLRRVTSQKLPQPSTCRCTNLDRDPDPCW